MLSIHLVNKVKSLLYHGMPGRIFLLELQGHPFPIKLFALRQNLYLFLPYSSNEKLGTRDNMIPSFECIWRYSTVNGIPCETAGTEVGASPFTAAFCEVPTNSDSKHR